MPIPATTPASETGLPAKDLLITLAICAAMLAIGLALPERDALGRSLPLSFGLGTAFGLVLQRSRFCFWCILNDFFERRDARGLLGILAALAIGMIGYTAVFGAWVPNPLAGRLPPDAHVGPVSGALALGAAVFGFGMALSGSCISAHFYRLGEGAFGSILALFGALIGFFLGFLSWNWLFLLDIHRAQVIWLPNYLGHGGALALGLAVIAALALWLMRYPLPAPGAPAKTPFEALFRRRWPAAVGGALVGWIAVIAYFRVGPLGVTAELGSISRTIAEGQGWLPDRLHGLDSFAGCVTVVKEALLSRNGVFVIGMVLASFASARLSRDWQPALPAVSSLPRLFVGGVLLGWGAMVALGCTVGVLLSGIMAGALAGWIFAGFCLLGAFAGWWIRKRF